MDVDNNAVILTCIIVYLSSFTSLFIYNLEILLTLIKIP